MILLTRPLFPAEAHPVRLVPGDSWISKLPLLVLFGPDPTPRSSLSFGRLR